MFLRQVHYSQIETILFREGGLYSYLGTKDLALVEERIRAGEDGPHLVFEAMVYQIAKEIGAMAASLQGFLDAILLTGRHGPFGETRSQSPRIRLLDRARSHLSRVKMNCRLWPKALFAFFVAMNPLCSTSGSQPRRRHCLETG